MAAWPSLLGPDEKTWRAVVKSNGIAVDAALLEIEAGHVDLGPHPLGISKEEAWACVAYACAHLPPRWRDNPPE
ncbi:MAG TPA: hypothetical protein PK156_36795 [Polyangium sp.]|nr:hypothetical protein [Polyangium sp.]